MKKTLFITILIVMVIGSCQRESPIEDLISKHQYFSSSISWDISNMNTYGSGEIRYFGKKNKLKIFCNSFLRNQDSLTWGEPGIILKQGTWKIIDNYIVCEYRTTYRTFKMNLAEKLQKDTLKLEKATLYNKNSKLKSDVLISNEIVNFFNLDWSKIK
jgi:hypothetical protein